MESDLDFPARVGAKPWPLCSTFRIYENVRVRVRLLT